MPNRNVTISFFDKNADAVRAHIAELQEDSDKLTKTTKTITFDARTEDASAKMDELVRQGKALGVGKFNIKVTADPETADAQMDLMRAKAKELGLTNVNIRVNTTGGDKAVIALTGMSQEAIRAKAVLADATKAVDDVGQAAADAGDDVLGMSKNMGNLTDYAMPALIGAAVAVSPVVITAALGLGLFGGAAIKLLPELLKTDSGLQGLETRFDSFSQSLKPEVVSAFDSAIDTANAALTGLEPTARIAGNALDTVLAGVDREFESGQWQNFFAFMRTTAGPDVRLLGQNFTDLMKVLPPLLEDLQPIAVALLRTTDAAVKLTLAIVDIPHFLVDMGKAAVTGKLNLDDLSGSATKATGDIGSMGNIVGDVTPLLNVQHVAVAGLTAAVNALLTPILSLEGDQVAWRQSQIAATSAIKGTTGSLDTNRSSALAARAAIIQSTQSAITFANQEATVHGNITKASDVLQTQIRYLQDHAGHSRIAAQEIDILRQALDRLPKNITTKITEYGHGSFIIGQQVGEGVFAKPGVGGGFASGGRIPGYGGGDRHVIAVESGEAIVDKDRTRALAPLFGAIGIPGFASGGLVNDATNRNTFAGMGSWVTGEAQHTYNAMTKALEDAIKQASIISVPNVGGSGVARWAPDVLRVLAMLGLPSSYLGTILAQINTESGGNANAINLSDSNARAGHPSMGLMQTIIGTFDAYAGPFRSLGPFNGFADIYAGTNYAAHRYGRAGMLGVLGHGHGYANGGVISEPVLGMGLNSGEPYSFAENGLPEVVTPMRRMQSGGNTYVINIAPTPLAHPADIGREVVNAIRVFEQRSGKRWRS